MESRFGRAITLSMGTHVAGALVLGFFLTGRGNLTVSSPSPIPLDSRVVWVPGSGLPAGAIGGGDGQTAPPQSMRVPGPGDIAVPVSRTTRIVPSASPQDQPDPSTLAVPLQPATAGLDDIPGLIQVPGVGEPPSRGPGQGVGVGPGRGTQVGSTSGLGVNDGPPGSGGGIEWPQPVFQVKPQYTAEAMRAKLQGMVTLEVVVRIDGTVGDAKVVRSLDPIFGLDQAAIAAVKAWKFKPGMRDGKPIPVLVTVEMSFTLR